MANYQVYTQRNGGNLYYTGRAGVWYVSGDHKEAFNYGTHEAASARAAMLNRMEPVTGLYFQALNQASGN